MRAAVCRAFGEPLFAAAARTVAEDFQVTENLGWNFSGDGEHDYLCIEKTGANTEWVARQLARFADVPVKDIGYAGLKDRRAVTRQWFSVPRWNSPHWTLLDVEGVAILDINRHGKKLRRGAHKSNAFKIRLRGSGLAKHSHALASRIDTLRAKGVPNYFGEQRFGRHGSNLELTNAWAVGKRLPRHKRSLAISVARSFMFNEALDVRVRDGSWNIIREGDYANLDGSNSVFIVNAVDEQLERRCRDMDIHPAGELAGKNTVAGREEWLTALGKARVEPAMRSLRLKIANLRFGISDENVDLSFSLGRGAFATSVLREIADVTPSQLQSYRQSMLRPLE